MNKDGKGREGDLDKFIALQNEYLERFGMSSNMKKFLEIKVYLTELRAQYILTKNKMLLNQIEIEEINLNNADPSSEEGMTTGQMLVHLRKWTGIWIDKKKITIVEFRELTDEYVRSNTKR